MSKPDLAPAAAELSLFARMLLRHWLERWGHRLNKRRRLVAKQACGELVVKFDAKLQEAKGGDDATAGYVYHATPWTIYVAKDGAGWSLTELIAHELAHLVCMLRWKDGGHGARFTRTEKQVRGEGLEK